MKMRELCVFSILLNLIGFSFVPKSDNAAMIFIAGGVLKTIDQKTEKDIKIEVKPFYIDKNLVSVADFESFTIYPIFNFWRNFIFFFFRSILYSFITFIG